MALDLAEERQRPPQWNSSSLPIKPNLSCGRTSSRSCEAAEAAALLSTGLYGVPIIAEHEQGTEFRLVVSPAFPEPTPFTKSTQLRSPCSPLSSHAFRSSNHARNCSNRELRRAPSSWPWRAAVRSTAGHRGLHGTHPHRRIADQRFILKRTASAVNFARVPKVIYELTRSPKQISKIRFLLRKT